MRFGKLSVAAAAATILAGVGVSALPAAAQDSIYVPLFTYRTGPFSGSGTLNR